MHDVHARGAAIPALGLGTWQLSGPAARERVREALAMGYRHLDTAQMYGNEADVGAGLRDSGLPREQVFLTTKIWPDRFRDGDFQAAVRESLQRLGCDHVDLLLLHWPSPEVPLEETLGALDQVRDQGLTRHAGVSNFPSRLFREAEELSEAPLVVDQVEYHPYLNQDRLRTTLAASGTALVAYAPLAKGRVAREPLLQEIARELGVSASQVGLRWLVQQSGVAAIPRSSRLDHLRSNLAVFDFQLSPEQMRRIAGLAQPDGRLVQVAGFTPDWD